MNQRENENPWILDAKLLKKRVRQEVAKREEELNDILSLFFVNNCILSGSCISSIYHYEIPNDFDFWLQPERFSNVKSIRKTIQEQHSADILDISESYADGNVKNASQPCVTANAITFKNKFQLITLADYYTARKDFDLVHCKPYFDLKNDKFFISEHQFRAIQQKKLIQQDPGNIIKDYRVNKFKDRGWTQ